MTDLMQTSHAFKVHSARIDVRSDRIEIARLLRRRISFDVAQLRLFALVPLRLSNAFDSELYLKWDDGGRDSVISLGVFSNDPQLQGLADLLLTLRPDASLLHLPADDALDRLEVLGSEKIGALIGVGVLGAILIGATALITRENNLLGRIICPSIPLGLTLIVLYAIKRFQRVEPRRHSRTPVSSDDRHLPPSNR